MNDAFDTQPCPSFDAPPARHQMYLTDGHRDTVAMIKAWSRFDRAVLILSGPANSGKTVLASEIAVQLSDSMRVGRVSLDRRDDNLAAMVPKAFGIKSADYDQGITRLLAQSRAARTRYLLIVDNAHLISDSSKDFLEELTGTTDRSQPIYVLLVCRDDTTVLPDDPGHEVLRKRMSGRLQMQPFSAAQTAQYIAHRFRVGKCPCHDDGQPFDGEGLWLIHEASGGFPGNIDRLVQRCMSWARPGTGNRVADDVVRSCLADMEGAGNLPYPLPRRPADEFEIQTMRNAVFPMPAEFQGGGDDMDGEVRYVLEMDDPLWLTWLKPGLAATTTAVLLGVGAYWMTSGKDQTGQLSRSQPPVVEETAPRAEPLSVERSDPTVAQVDTRIEQTAPDARDLLIQALAIGPDDPESAAMAYARAALWGSQRAAYYLGQFYETGMGVEINLDEARAWYLEAPQIKGAGERLRGVEAASNLSTTAVFAAPIPQRQIIVAAGQSELYWRAPSGPNPARYRIEYVTLDDERVQTVETGVSATLIPGQVSRWRVLALDRNGTPGAASSWVEPDRDAL